MGRPVVHFEITGKDGAALQKYYAELFDWKIDANNEYGYGIVSEAGIGGGISTGPDGYPGHVTVYVQVDDVEAALARAEELGGTRTMGPEKVMESLTIGLFTDPEGHVIGVMNGDS
jgi:predicted enzyme related to lactoylglutathione lyase